MNSFERDCLWQYMHKFGKSCMGDFPHTVFEPFFFDSPDSTTGPVPPPPEAKLSTLTDAQCKALWNTLCLRESYCCADIVNTLAREYHKRLCDCERTVDIATNILGGIS